MMLSCHESIVDTVTQWDDEEGDEGGRDAKNILVAENAI